MNDLGARVNLVSPIASALSIMFLYMIITNLILELLASETSKILKGCEIKSVKNENYSDPCMVCRFNDKNILSMFKFDVIKISDLFSEKEYYNLSKILKEIIRSKKSIEKDAFIFENDIFQIFSRHFSKYIPVFSSII